MTRPDDNRFESVGTLHCESQRIQLLTTALHQARFGELSTHWRDELVAPTRVPGTPTLYTDGDHLAIEAIRLLPPASWEPGHATDWRSALDAWYSDCLRLLDDLADFNAQSLSKMVPGNPEEATPIRTPRT